MLKLLVVLTIFLNYVTASEDLEFDDPEKLAILATHAAQLEELRTKRDAQRAKSEQIEALLAQIRLEKQDTPERAKDRIPQLLTHMDSGDVSTSTVVTIVELVHQIDPVHSDALAERLLAKLQVSANGGSTTAIKLITMAMRTIKPDPDAQVHTSAFSILLDALKATRYTREAAPILTATHEAFLQYRAALATTALEQLARFQQNMTDGRLYTTEEEIAEFIAGTPGFLPRLSERYLKDITGYFVPYNCIVTLRFLKMMSAAEIAQIAHSVVAPLKEQFVGKTPPSQIAEIIAILTPRHTHTDPSADHME